MSPISSFNQADNPVWAVVQVGAGTDSADNLQRSLELVKSAAKDATFVALPEFFLVRGSHETIRRNAIGSMDSDIIDEIREVAREHSVAILAGSLPFKHPNHPTKCYNRSLLINDSGEIQDSYDKIHLFDVEIENELSVKESELLASGNSTTVTTVDEISVGLSICYDLRFPSLYGKYSSHGAQALAVPSNFTRETGRAHWLPLLRARAIENQSYVIAPNQIGENPETGVPSLGQSCIVDPWGSVITKCSDLETWTAAEINLDYLDRIRRELPSLEHKTSRFE